MNTTCFTLLFVQNTMYFQVLVTYTYVTSIGREEIFKPTTFHEKIELALSLLTTNTHAMSA